MRIRPPDWDIQSIRFLINSIYCYNIHFLFRVFSSKKRRLICELFARLVRLFLTCDNSLSNNQNITFITYFHCERQTEFMG